MREASIKAIETEYNGYLFRSRLEARWAVFFDALGIEYHYEPEGFNLSGIRYLPDFFLPQVNMWAEVKPTELTDEEKTKCIRLVEATGKGCLLLIGPPDFKPYWAYIMDGVDITKGHVENTAMISLWDYALTTDYLHEHRFYCACAGFYEQESDFDNEYIEAIYAARQARFEHGG